ncbi:MAG: ATP-binding cassette domain-containing protein [Lachnospiraceae bacterium]|nr:ATP-binding cassette domain-containing protein [Lachnospiraceae bacterium]
MIEVKNLVKVYGINKAVDNLNFKVEKGQILGFLGPNGAGKSTTMNIITGYISATEGTVLINGYDILKQPEEAKSFIGYLPEQPPVYMDMTVKEYLIFAAKLKGVKKREILGDVTMAMESTKLFAMEDRLIGNLSKGYRQRVGIAAALLGKPEILILDEPTVGLDPKQIIEIRDLIKSLAEKHTVILSSHILQEISAVCDRIIIINNGNLVVDEMLEDLNKNIADAQCLVVTLRTSKKIAEDMFKGKDYIREFEVVDSADSGCVDVRIFFKDSADRREDVFKLIVDSKVVLLQMYNDMKSLEDIFIEATTPVYVEPEVIVSDETEGKVCLTDEEYDEDDIEEVEDDMDSETTEEDNNADKEEE